MKCAHEDCTRLIRATGRSGPLPLRCPEHTAEHNRLLTNKRKRAWRARQRATA